MGTHIDAAERKEHGTCENKKACGDAEAAAREGCAVRHILQYVKWRAMAVIGSVANVEMLPVPMLPISNWGLKLVRVGVGLWLPK